MNISINDLEIEYRDIGPWRSYSMETNGETITELAENACISETDQDGGEIRTYALDDAPNDVFTKCMEIIADRCNRALYARNKPEGKL